MGNSRDRDLASLEAAVLSLVDSVNEWDARQMVGKTEWRGFLKALSKVNGLVKRLESTT